MTHSQLIDAKNHHSRISIVTKRWSQLMTGIVLLIISYSGIASERFKIGLAVWSGYPESVKGFKEGLAEQGLIEGQNVTFIQGEKSTNEQLQKNVALSFKNAKVDLVYSLTTAGTNIVKSVMPETTPIVFSIVTYPADSGLIESFEYSGNNLTGTSNYVPIYQYFNLLKLILPRIKTIAIFHRKNEPNSKIQSANMLRVLKREGIIGLDREPENIAQVTRMGEELIGKVDAFMTTTDTLMQSGGEKALIKLSLKNKIPILSSNKTGIIQGSTFGPVADFHTLGKMAGKKAALILMQGASPSRIRSEIQQPPLFLVNRHSTEMLGISISRKAQKLITWIGE